MIFAVCDDHLHSYTFMGTLKFKVLYNYFKEKQNKKQNKTKKKEKERKQRDPTSFLRKEMVLHTL